MNNITVIMSTYNGSKFVEKQIESILTQKGVNLTLYVRDDGSKDDTVKILQVLAKKHNNIIISPEQNVGWEHSFLIALKNAPKADFYAFSDQDDFWFDDKLSSGIKFIEQSGIKSSPLMYHCNKISVDEDLKPYMHQIRRIPHPLNRQNAMVQEYAQGCSIILNEEARKLVTRHIPKSKLGHDFWCGLLCYLFGKVIYDNKPYFYHITHGCNASGEGHIIRGWIGRLKILLEKPQAYYFPYMDLIVGYSDLLNVEDRQFIYKVENYKKSICDKLSLLFSRKFVRGSVLGTISLKVAILFNKL